MIGRGFGIVGASSGVEGEDESRVEMESSESVKAEVVGNRGRDGAEPLELKAAISNCDTGVIAVDV